MPSSGSKTRQAATAFRADYHTTGTQRAAGADDFGWLYFRMFFRQFYDDALAQASYLIGCQATGEAVVVDPIRDIEPYIDVATAEGLRITHVTETHIHADFVSGARELVARTGAALFLSAEGGTDWQYAYATTDAATLLRDASQIRVGNVYLDVMHTPGHTPEHLSFIVTDTPRGVGAMGILSGDFVFVGDVGRPDLLEKAAHVANTMDAAARTLFHSLQRFRALPDYLQVWPGHGAGSACGKALGAVPSTTVGYEKRVNWGVSCTDEETFVRSVLDGQPEPPRYFAEMKRINRDGPAVLGALPMPTRCNASEIVRLADRHAWIIDLRAAADFAKAHVPGALSIPYARSFSTWCGWLVPYDADVTLLVPSGHDDDAEAVVHRASRDLALIGLDRVTGWMHADDAITAWTTAGRHTGSVAQVDVHAVGSAMPDTPLPVIDVRGHAEWEAGHLPGVRNVPVGLLTAALDTLPTAPFVVQCQSGARSMIAASVLHRLGRTDVRNLVGGFASWNANGFPIEH